MNMSKLQKMLGRTGLLMSAVVLSSTAFAGTFTFVAKQPDPKGQMQYKYQFSCASGQNQGTFTVTAKSDEEAKKAAEQKVKVVCEE